MFQFIFKNALKLKLILAYTWKIYNNFYSFHIRNQNKEKHNMKYIMQLVVIREFKKLKNKKKVAQLQEVRMLKRCVLPLFFLKLQN